MHPEAAAIFDTVLGARTATRAFRPEPVPRQQLRQILETARAAPSNFNSQPWRVYVLAGKARQALGDALLQAHVGHAVPAFSPFPQALPPDCESRVNDFGNRLYTAVGVDRKDMAARARQSGRNFTFFGAPVGLIFTIDSTLTKHSWLDYGLFIQTLMLAAQVRGLATCPQVSFVRFQSIIAEQLGLGPQEAVTCGMSLGYADEQAPVNRLNMPRQPLEDFTHWLGFDD